MKDILINSKWLMKHLYDKDTVIIDCRFRLNNYKVGREMYKEGHIPGAYFLDLEEDLSGIKDKHGGRHPLPDEKFFLKTLEKCNVNKKSKVIAYDDQMAGSGRLWFLLKYIGHKKAFILDGGIQDWIDNKYPISKEIPSEGNGKVVPKINKNMIASLEDVKKLNKKVLVDCRENIRYEGIEEPIDLKAGHIPNAINIPYTELLEKCSFVDKKKMKEVFKNVPDDSIVYCGSGVTSCVNFVAMSEIGNKPRVYIGSWSDWISYEDNEIARKE
ncbi:MAG: sulfurtransferase [Thermoplasmataceae archaeon]